MNRLEAIEQAITLRNVAREMLRLHMDLITTLEGVVRTTDSKEHRAAAKQRLAALHDQTSVHEQQIEGFEKQIKALKAANW